MIVVADTNVILRTVITDDDEEQTARAMAFLEKADKIIVPVVVFCEVAWFLRQRYKCQKGFVSAALRVILNAEHVVTDEEAVLAGCASRKMAGILRMASSSMWAVCALAHQVCFCPLMPKP